jgi:succinate dehydrogenase hydrophobic anchor subunit
MDRHPGQHANAAIFAANGPARHRLLQAASAVSLALLAAWLIALAPGI